MQTKGALVAIINIPSDPASNVNGFAGFIVENGYEAFKKIKPVPVSISNCFLNRNGKLLHFEVESIKILDEKGKPTGETELFFQTPKVISSAIEVRAYTRDSAQKSWGRLIRWKDKDDYSHQWAMPMESFSGNGEQVRKLLLDCGCYISPSNNSRSLLNVYLQTREPDDDKRVRCTDQTGWHGNTFVMPTSSIGEKPEELIFQGNCYVVTSLAGSLDGWKNTVGKFCVGNSRVSLAVCAAFAGPLLNLFGKECGGIHFVGTSSIGKTTILLVASSIYSGHNFIQQWRATINGLEGIASAHNDMVLILDELSQVASKDAGEIAYMLGNGQAKGRATQHGDPRKRKTWKLIYISSGEISLGDHLAVEGKKVKAGMEVRLVNIPADTGCYGVYEELHGYESGKDLSEALKLATGRNHGHPGKKFIEMIIRNRKIVEEIIMGVSEKFLVEVDQAAHGQVLRVASRFALFAAAGEVATEFGITGWPKGWAIEAVSTCFRAWAESRGGILNASEEMEIITQLRRFFEVFGASRFSEWNDPEGRIINNRAGFKRKIKGENDVYEYFVLPETFKQDLCSGLDKRSVEKILIKRGILISNTERGSSVISLPGMGKKRCYHITSQILEA